MYRAVVGLMFDKTGEDVVLINKRRPAWQSGKWNGPGGSIKDRESHWDAMVREFYEETGVKTGIMDWTTAVILKGTNQQEQEDWEVFFLFAFNDQAVRNAKTQTDELIQIYFERTLPRNLVAGLEWIIPLCRDVRLDPEGFPLVVVCR